MMECNGIAMLPEQLKPNAIIRGPLFPDTVQVVVATQMGGNVKFNGYGLKTSKLGGVN